MKCRAVAPLTRQPTKIPGANIAHDTRVCRCVRKIGVTKLKLRCGTKKPTDKKNFGDMCT